MKNLDWAALAAWVTIVAAAVIKICCMVSNRYRTAIEKAVSSKQFRQDMEQLKSAVSCCHNDMEGFKTEINDLKDGMRKVLVMCTDGAGILKSHDGRLERIEKHLDLNGWKNGTDSR